MAKRNAPPPPRSWFRRGSPTPPRQPPTVLVGLPTKKRRHVEISRLRRRLLAFGPELSWPPSPRPGAGHRRHARRPRQVHDPAWRRDDFLLLGEAGGDERDAHLVTPHRVDDGPASADCLRVR